MGITVHRLHILAFLIVLLSSGCDSRSDYESLVEHELATGEQYNELFLGYELGMSKKEFYDHSWALNRKGLVMQGPQNQTVQYELDDELPHAAKMFFYADFHDDKVFQMRVRFLYDGWAPWNRDLSADSLQLAVVDLFSEWYGDGFIVMDNTTDNPDSGINYVKVDGNRRIVVGKVSDSDVMSVFTDVVVERQIEQENRAQATN